MAGTSPAMTRKGQSIRRLVSFPWLRGSWSGFRSGGIGVLSPLVPAKAGTQGSRRRTRSERPLDSRLRGNERMRVVDQLDRDTLSRMPPAFVTGPKREWSRYFFTNLRKFRVLV